MLQLVKACTRRYTYKHPSGAGMGPLAVFVVWNVPSTLVPFPNFRRRKKEETEACGA